MPASAVLRRFAPPLATLALVLLAGCSSGSDVLVRVGDRAITTEEFESVARGNEAQYPGPADSAKAELLEDLTRRLLLLAEAEARGLFRDTLTVNFRRAAEERALVTALYDRMASPPPVSNAEVGRFAAWRDSAARLQLIYTPSRVMADQAVAALNQGAPFEQVADRFNVAGLLPPGGDLGVLVPGSLVAPLDGYLRTAPVGRIVGPVEAPGEGWFVLRVTTRMPNPRPQGPEQAEQLREMLRQRKTRLVRMNATFGLREAWGLRLAPDGAQTLFQRFNRAVDPATGQLLPPAPPSPEEGSTVLATYEGGSYTLADALADLDRPEDRPNPAMLTEIQAWLENQVTRRIAVAEARKRQLDREPAVRAQIDRAVENYVLDAIYRTDVLAEAQADDAYLRRYFEEHRDRFERLDAVELETVTLPDTTGLSAILAAGESAGSLAEALAAAGVSAPVATRVVTFPAADPLMHLLYSTFYRTPAGRLVPPQQTADGTLVMRVASKQQSPQTYDRLTPETAMALQAEAREQKADEAFRRVTDHLRRLHPPVTYPERLRRIPWPIRPAGAAAAS